MVASPRRRSSTTESNIGRISTLCEGLPRNGCRGNRPNQRNYLCSVRAREYRGNSLNFFITFLVEPANSIERLAAVAFYPGQSFRHRPPLLHHRLPSAVTQRSINARNAGYDGQWLGEAKLEYSLDLGLEQSPCASKARTHRRIRYSAFHRDSKSRCRDERILFGMDANAYVISHAWGKLFFLQTPHASAIQTIIHSFWGSIVPSRNDSILFD